MGSAVGQNLTVLLFEVDGHRYGVDASQVLEVVRAVQLSRLAQAPDIVEGIVNVRGRLAAVIDLRARFALTPRAIAPTDMLVLCALEERMIALRVDRALELESADASMLVEPASVSVAATLARGMLERPDGALLICDLAAFLSEAEQLALDRAVARTPDVGASP